MAFTRFNYDDCRTKKILQETLKKYEDRIHDDGIVIYFKNIDKNVNDF